MPYIIFATDRTAVNGSAEVRVVRSTQRYKGIRVRLSTSLLRAALFKTRERAQQFVVSSVALAERNGRRLRWAFSVEPAPGKLIRHLEDKKARRRKARRVWAAAWRARKKARLLSPPAPRPSATEEARRLARSLADGPFEDEEQRRCRVCGCTDDYACPEGCSWVDDDLCSACVEIPPDRARARGV